MRLVAPWGLKKEDHVSSRNSRRATILGAALLGAAMGTIFLESAHAQFACPSPPQVHFVFRKDVWTGIDAEIFVNSKLAPILGVSPTIIDAGSGAPSVTGVQAACDGGGCLAAGAHYAITFAGAGGGLGANPVGDAFTSSLPFGFSAQEHHQWLWDGGGLALEQASYDVLSGGEVKVIPIIMSGPEHGLWWRDVSLPWQGGHRALPNTVAAAEAVFEGQLMRFFGNGGRLMVDCFGVSNLVTPGVTPYGLMQSQSVIGTDFLSASGDLDVFIDRPGLNVLNAGSVEDPAGPITSFGYKTFYAEGWHQLFDVFELLINRNYYDNCLTDDQRDALHEVGRSFMLESREMGIERNRQAVKEIRQHLQGVGGSFHNSAWPQKLLNELQFCASTLFAEIAASDANFKAVFDSMNAFKPYDPQGHP
jgi:hypothetical protein